MVNSLFDLDSILGLVTPQMAQSLATRLGETPQTAANGLRVATGATLGSLASQAGDLSFMDKVVQLAGSASKENLLALLPSIASGGPTGAMGELVSRFLLTVFGPRQGTVTDQIAQRAGISSGSGVGILKMAAPLILGYLGKLHASGSLTPATLGNALRAEAPSLGHYAPAADVLPEITATVHDNVARSVRTVGSATRDRLGFKWLWAAAIAGIALLGFFVLRLHSKEVSQAANEATTAVGDAASNTAGSAVAALGDFTKVVLPDGTELHVPAHGVEARLVQYLHDTATPGGEMTWFDFDRLRFDTGKATLQAASDEQLNNIAVILKAYPTAKIRLGAYTDNTGDSASNQLLSENRAQNVMAALTARGVDASRLSAKGYGAENPVADNSTAEGRQKNRRIAIRVAEK